MKKDIHPQWFAEATVVCACGNTWNTGAAVAEIRTDICSACHPFYTGEQRIVDTEGRVDKFMNRLKRRDNIRAEAEAREAAKTPMDLPISELGLNKRTQQLLIDNDINIVADFLEKLNSEGDEAFLELPGIGRQVLAEVKRTLRGAGYDVPTTAETAAAAEVAEAAEEE